MPNSIITENIREYYSNNKEFIVNVNKSNVDVCVFINNINITNTTDENGIAVFTLPILDSGLYTITTSYNDISVINTINVLDTIEVPREITVGYNANVNIPVIYYDKDGNIIDNETFQVINQIGTYYKNFTNYLTNQTITSKINVVSRFSDNKNVDMYYFDDHVILLKYMVMMVNW